MIKSRKMYSLFPHKTEHDEPDKKKKLTNCIPSVVLYSSMTETTDLVLYVL